MKLPQRLPVSGPFGRLYEHINQLRDYVASLTPLPSHRMKTTHTAVGVAREPEGRSSNSSNSAGPTPRWG